MSKKNKKNNPQVDIPKKKKAEASKENNYLLLLIIATITFLAYLPALSNGFVNLDDDRYITNNPKLFLQSISDFFSIPGGYHMGNYHPLTMLGYKIIYSFSKLDPFAYHLVCIIIHILNSLLSFYVIKKLCGIREIAFIAALLFGVHTMHVESVAWVSELKDQLHTFFYFSALIYYLKYIENTEGKRNYFITLVLFLLAILSKAQATSFTILIIAVDFYKYRKFDSKTIIEKIPFFIISLIFGVIAIYAQQSMGAIQEAVYENYERIPLAAYGYITYLWKMLLPINLSAYYAYPLKVNNALPSYYYLYLLLSAAIVAFAFYSLKWNRKIFFGIAFFSITIFLVLQILAVGGAVMADRYSYIPSLGIIYLFAEGIYYLYSQSQFKQIAIGLLIISTLGFTYATYERCKIWRDGMSMWSDVIEKSQTIVLAFNNRGTLYNTQGQALLDSSKTNPALKQKANEKFYLAIADLSNALRLNSSDDQAQSNIGLSYWRLGKLDSAIYYTERSLKSNPNYSIGWSNLGSIYFSAGRKDEALNAYEKAVEYDPGFADAWYNIGIFNYNAGNKQRACEALQKAAGLGMEHAANAFRDLCK